MPIHTFTNTIERLEPGETLVSSTKCCNDYCTLEILPVFAYYVSYLCPMHLCIIYIPHNRMEMVVYSIIYTR